MGDRLSEAVLQWGFLAVACGDVGDKEFASFPLGLYNSGSTLLLLLLVARATLIFRKLAVGLTGCRCLCT